MKKLLATVLALALLTGALFALTACGNEATAPAGEPAENSEQAAESSSNAAPIVGEWKNDTTYPGSVFVYTFKEDGTGQYDAAGNIMKFTYETDGDKISILYDGNTDPFETTFSIDGDTLNVVDSVGKDTLYQKVK